MQKTQRLPAWFRQSLPSADRIAAFKSSFDKHGLNTVCQRSRCPNLGTCWDKGVATFMILGDICTRQCRFCAVQSGSPKCVNLDEPLAVAQEVKRLQLDHVVITSVTRDDLDDNGAEHFVKTISEMRLLNPETKIEVLIPDFSGNEKFIKMVVAARPEVIAHNIETVKRLTPSLRPQADYERSLFVLGIVKRSNPEIFVKSGLMLGLGETIEDIEETLRDLVFAGCDILTLGQYLAPSKTSRHVRVERFITLKEFEQYREKALALGFKYVLSAPLVRSSYLAKEAFDGCREEVLK